MACILLVSFCRVTERQQAALGVHVEFGKNMRHPGFFNTLPMRGQPQRRVRAFTLLELLIAMAILGTLGAIAVPMVSNNTEKARIATSMTDIREMELGIARFQAEHGRPPDTLAEAGISIQRDPWGRPYRYVRIQGLTTAERDAKCRWDKYDKPLNHDFDLYSVGKDGKTMAKITQADSHDDIIRAHNGRYVGLASEY